MKSFLLKSIFAFFCILVSGCGFLKTNKPLQKHYFPIPIDTKTKEIKLQERKDFEVGGIFATNDYPTARLNDFSQINDSTWQATIDPENSPINESPWYGFKIWAEKDTLVNIKLFYSVHEHRYLPKLSHDGEHWTAIDTNNINLVDDSVNAILKLPLTNKPLWISAQEIQDHERVGNWIKDLNKHDFIQTGSAGTSIGGRSLYFIDISKGELKKKPTVVVISRQHPPEVTGYFAMQAFVETIVEQGNTNGFLDQFRVMVYPLMNPDGVDEGHHRHNMGGIDLNRDWAYYNQPEIQQVTTHIVDQTILYKNNVILGLDFHSTYYDVYYTIDATVKNKIPGFTQAWLAAIQSELKIDDINEQPSGYGAPISKGWFNKQFGAESITYEIGDDTPRDYIKTKGEVSANTMMHILMENKLKWKY